LFVLTVISDLMSATNVDPDLRERLLALADEKIGRGVLYFQRKLEEYKPDYVSEALAAMASAGELIEGQGTFGITYRKAKTRN